MPKLAKRRSAARAVISQSCDFIWTIRQSVLDLEFQSCLLIGVAGVAVSASTMRCEAICSVDKVWAQQENRYAARVVTEPHANGTNYFESR